MNLNKHFFLSLTVTFLVQVHASLIVFTPPVIAVIAQYDIGVSAASVGIVTSLIYFSSVFSAFFSGVFLKKRNGFFLSQICLLFSFFGTLLFTLSTPFFVIIGALVIGMGYGAITPASSDILSEVTPFKYRSFVFSIKQSGVPIGGILAGIFIPYLLSIFEWTEVLFFISSCSLLIILFCESVKKSIQIELKNTVRNKHNFLTTFRLLSKNKKLKTLAFSSFAFSGMQMCLGSYLVVTIVEQYNFHLSIGGGILSVSMIGGFIGRLFWGYIAVKIKGKYILFSLGIAMSLASFFTLFINAEWSLFQLYLLFFIFGSTSIGWNGIYLAEVTRVIRKEEIGMATGLTLSITYLGVVILPIFFWLIFLLFHSYSLSFASIGLVTLWRSISLVYKDYS